MLEVKCRYGILGLGVYFNYACKRVNFMFIMSGEKVVLVSLAVIKYVKPVLSSQQSEGQIMAV